MPTSVNVLEWGSDDTKVIVENSLEQGQEVIVDNFVWSQLGNSFYEMGKKWGFDLLIHTKDDQCRFVKGGFQMVYRENLSN